VAEFLHAFPAWFQLVFLAICSGTIICRLWLFDASAGEPSFQVNMTARLWRLFNAGVAVILACSVADLLIGTAEMSGSTIQTLFPLLPTVMLKTHFGRVWLIRMVSLVALSLAANAWKKRRSSRLRLYLLLGILAIIAMTESASGHAADKGDFSFAEIADWFHLLGASVWGGGLFVLAGIVLPELTRSEETSSLLAYMARRFSTLAAFAVGIVALTALCNAWLYVGSLEALWTTLYGWIVFAKAVLFLLLIAFGVFNRYVNVPLLLDRAGTPPEKHRTVEIAPARLFAPSREDREENRTAARFVTTVRFEAFLMALVLLGAALLRHEAPARHVLHIGHALAGPDHGMHMHYAPHPDSAVVRIKTDAAIITAGVPVSISIRLEDRAGKPLQNLTTHHERAIHAVIIGRDLSVFAHIHPEDLGTITGEMLDTATFPLRYTFPKAGTYLLGIDFATKDGIYSKTAKLRVFGQPHMGEPQIDFSTTKNFGPYQVTLRTAPERIRAGEETTLNYFIRMSGKPLTDLGPYLGAAMHLAIVRSDLTQFIHAHGDVPEGSQDQKGHMHAMLPEQFGPVIDCVVIFPVKGTYRIFSQVNHGGEILHLDFTVNVE